MSTPVAFRRGEVRLQARFHEAAGKTRRPTVILLQGSPGDEEDVLGLGEPVGEMAHTR
jgi:hypothetical protein